MANVRKTRAGRFELTITSKLLPRGRLWFTFDSQAEAEAYGAQVRRWLDAGVVPPELAAAGQGRQVNDRLGPIIRAWCNAGHPSAADQEVLGRLLGQVGDVRLADLDYVWCERWVQQLKLEANLTPGSIRKRVQALSRALDWHLRRTPGVIAGNPLRLLPRGYSTYSPRDAELLAAAAAKRPDGAAGRAPAPRADQQRDRRLASGEEDAIRAAMAGVKRADRERALRPDPQFQLLFSLILATGLRLREAYRLRTGQVDLAGRVLRPQSSKVWHGAVRHRTVPLTPALHAELTEHLAAMRQAAGGLLADDAPLFSTLWDGDTSAPAMRRTTNRLSARFAAAFAYAGVNGLTEHDLRHEATCRWLELRAPDGQWLFRLEEVNRIMGWSPTSPMARRYASFRAEDLAARLWLVPAAKRVA